MNRRQRLASEFGGGSGGSAKGNLCLRQRWQRQGQSLSSAAVAARGAVFTVAATCLLLIGQMATGQEALNVSLQGDQAAAAQHEADAQVGYYNLLTGPVGWRFSSGVQLTYNDNIHLTSQNPEGDFIFQPNAGAQMTWPVTPLNTLNLNIAGGYSFYLQNSDLDQFYINQGSGLSFNLWVGDVVFNFHDRVSITQNAYQNQSANGNTIYSTLQNAVGVSGLWNLNGGEVSFDYDHVNYITLKSSQNTTPDSSTDNITFSGGIRVVPEILVGLETGGSLINYDNSSAGTGANSPDATQWNAGAFCSAQISEYLNARLDAGYTEYLPNSTGTNFNSSVADGYYFDLMLAHRVNNFFNYTLSANRSVDFQNNGQPYETYGVQWQPVWNCFEYFTIQTPFSWHHGVQLNGQSASYDQYTVGINFGRQITTKLSGSISYQFVKETSPNSTQEYDLNIVSLSFIYQF